jgi:hypothetical protein
MKHTAKVVKATPLKWDHDSPHGGVNVEYSTGLQHAWELGDGEQMPQVGEVHDLSRFDAVRKASIKPARRTVKLERKRKVAIAS